MAIDLPPVIPPTQVDQTHAQAVLAGNPAAVYAVAGDSELRVYGNQHLSDSEVAELINAASNPSEAIVQLTRRYYEKGNLLVKVSYYRSLDAVLVFVNQLTVAEVKGDSRAVAHFKHLEGDADLKLAEYDTPRVLADLQAKRGGLDYSVSYEELGDNTIAMVFSSEQNPDNDATDFILEANDQGSRFLGRYFGVAGIKHRTEDGTQLSAAYQTAFADLGESRDGDDLNQLSFGIDHPFSFGLYGLDISKTDYSRSPRVSAANNGGGLGGALCSLTDALGLGILGDTLVGCPSGSNSTAVKLDAEILQLALRGEQVLYSTPWNRILLNQKIQHIDSSIEQKDFGYTLLDEVYQTAEIGAKYIKTTYYTEDSSASQLTLGLSLKAGIGDGGTLDDYSAYQQAYFTANPTASSAPEVVPQARSAEFIALLPTANYQLRLGKKSALNVTAKAQFSDEQVPQQQQFVLGGMNSLSAYLPGVLIGDSGYFVSAGLERAYQLGDFKLVPRVFAEYGGAWYENASSPEGDEQSVADAGLGLKVSFHEQLYSEVVVARPLTDDVQNEDFLESLEADFYWRVRLTF